MTARPLMKSGDRKGKFLLMEQTNNLGFKQWRCLCDCGTVKLVRQNHLVAGATRSCGCERKKAHNRVLGTLRGAHFVGRP